ncbi:MAG: hypothetical protein ABI685_09305 [Ferruginibacter sp.]
MKDILYPCCSGAQINFEYLYSSMITTNTAILKLFSIRNQYGKEITLKKLLLLNKINIKNIKGKKTAQALYSALLFLQAYPDNKSVYKQAAELLQSLKEQVNNNEDLKYKLYNSGVTGTIICAAFSFEMTKWLRKTKRSSVKFNSFESDDEQIQAFISVVMDKAESEIFQDCNAEWKDWLKKLRQPGEDILDQLIAIFDSSNIRPEVKDELWNAIGINVEINIESHCCLPASLTKVFYHRSLMRKEIKAEPIPKTAAVKLTDTEAAQIIDCSKMILIRHLREIDPISFTSAKLVSFYHLQRGTSIALLALVPQRRHPIDSYMAYVVFKNGLPVSYGASWVLFNSSRIALNVFPDYRGGEAKHIFNQVLQLHAQVYNLKRFSVDPYQIGKDNSDGIDSGSFWIYYHAGFRPIKENEKQLAEIEAAKIKTDKKYRTSRAILNALAESRLELILQKNATWVDATDMSRTYAGIIAKKYNGNRQLAHSGLRLEKDAAKKLATILQIKNYQEENMLFVLQNWAVFLLCKEKELKQNKHLKQTIKTLFNLKATGNEEAYITALQKAGDLRKLIEGLVKYYSLATVSTHL